MTGYEQLGYGQQQQFQPQGLFGGLFGSPVGGAIGGGIGGLFGNSQLGSQIGQTAGGFLGGLLPFGAEASGAGYGQGIQGQQGQQIASQFIQQHPLLQAILQHPILAQQFLQSHPVLQAALQDPQTAVQLVAQHPLLQQALQHPLIARQVMQQHPVLHQFLQQRALQQMQQMQQQQQQPQQQMQQPFQQQGQGGMQPQGWFGNLVSQYAQPVGSTVGGWLGSQGIGSAIGGVASQLGSMLPFSADPYSQWLQQQAIAAQYRGMGGGMQQFQPGQMYGGQPGQGIPGAQQGQSGGQTLH